MGNSLVIKDSQKNEVQLQIDDIRKFIAPTADEKEFWLFIQTAKALNLNPIKREIYFVKFNNQAQIITGYQVYLERASRSGLLEYWNVDVEKPDPKDRSTWIGVFTGKRTDWTKEFVWHVPMSEVDKKQSTWNLMPEFQLKKNTVSQGLRLLIPEILSGMPYTAEEVTAGTSEYVIDGQVIEPSESELQAKEKAKNDYLAKLASELHGINTIADLEKHYTKNKKAYDASELKDDILWCYEARKYDLNLYLLADKTGINALEIAEYMNKELMKSSVVVEALAGNEEAVKQFTADTIAFLNVVPEQADLDGLGSGEQERNLPT